jgi:hypothetical protein
MTTLTIDAPIGEVHSAFSKLNDMAQALGCSVFPYTRTANGPSVNFAAFKELMTTAIDLLESDAEVDDSPPLIIPSRPSINHQVWGNGQPQVFSPHPLSGGSGGPIPGVYTPVQGRPSVGPNNTLLRKQIAKYAGWSDDLLSHPSTLQFSRQVALNVIEMYIQLQGYNPASFSFRLDYDPSLMEIIVTDLHNVQNATMRISEQNACPPGVSVLKVGNKPQKVTAPSVSDPPVKRRRKKPFSMPKL